MSPSGQDQGSFRDPSGFVFSRKKRIYRQINRCYQEDYDHLINSGLYQDLVGKGLLIEHEEVDLAPADSSTAYKIIQPFKLPFLAYPYEWCFSQYKIAALTTLKIQKNALQRGMMLKDASAFNIQFFNNKPLLIDTLSFEIYEPGRPWDGYQQFCKHFLAPLCLMAYHDGRLNSLLRVYLDGIPLEMASSLLPLKTKFNFSILAHIHLHAKAQVQAAGRGREEEIGGRASKKRVSKEGILGLVNSLEKGVQKLTFAPDDTSWGRYSDLHNYSEAAYKKKKGIVDRFLKQANPDSVWDLGANTGDFSRLASSGGMRTIAFDIDPGAVEQGYLKSVREDAQGIDHFLIDLFNPSPSLGWEHAERKSLLERGGADLFMALALIHHLAIGNNLPFPMISKFLSRTKEWLIIEFVPKSDSQVRLLLSSRRDIFTGYTQSSFEDVFGKDFSILEREKIPGTERTLYLMKKRAS